MSTMTLSGAGAGGPSGQVVFGPITTTGNNGTVYEQSSVNLVSGANTITFTAGQYTAILISMPNGPGAATLQYCTSLDSAPGASFTPAASVGWAKLDIPATATSVTITASEAVPGIGIGFI